MLGKLLARGAAATHRQQAALASRRRPRVTSASLRGAHAPPSGYDGATGVQRQRGVEVDYVHSSSLGGARLGQLEADAEHQQQQGQQSQQQRQQPAGEEAEAEGEGAPWNRRSSRPRNSGGSRSGGWGGGRGGRGWSGRGGEFARRSSRGDRNGNGMSPSWHYSKTMGELKRTGNWMEAIEMYKQSATVDLVMYNSTITALARGPKWQVALSILQEMRDTDTVTPDTYTFNAALMACIHGRQGELAFALLGEMRGAGVAPDCFTFTHLVTICGQEGKWEAALSLVDEMKKAGLWPNCVTYNSVIVACGNGGEPDLAVRMLDRMREEGVQVSEGSYSAAIAACGKARQWERALHLLEEMKEGKDNLEPNEYCYNSAISACEKVGRWQEALLLLRDMQAAQLKVTGGSYAHVVKACTNAGEMAEARALLHEMRANGLEVKKGTVAMVERLADRHGARRSRDNNGASSEAAYAAQSDGRAVPHATRAHAPGDGGGNGDGVVDDPARSQAAASWWSNVLPTTTAAAARSGAPPPPPPASERQRMIPAVDEPGTTTDTPNRSAAAAKPGSDGAAVVVAGAGAAGAGAADAAVSSSVATVPSLPSPGTAAAARFSGKAAEMLASRTRSVKDFIRAVGSHSRNRRWPEILSDLDRAIANPNTKVSMRMYESCLTGLASGGKWVEALAVLERMRGEGLKPNPPCLTAAIKACAKANPPKWGLALSLLEGLDEPWVWAYVAALSAMARAGQWKAGTALLEQMRADGVEPNVFCYNGVLEASRRAEPPQWQHACSLLSQMKAEGVPPNEVCYKTAILACQAASEVGEAEALLSEMVEAGFAPQDELKANSGVVAQCASP